MSSFSDYAQEKMTDLYKNHSHEVGRELKKVHPEKYKELEATDCITYALNVISYAFKASGNAAAAKHVWGLGKHGSELAKYLVNAHGWKGVYINPDNVHPVDAQSEHTYSSYLASKSCRYYQVPLHFRVENYSTTPRSHSAFQKLNKNAGITTLNKVDIASLEQVKFGFGLSRGGMHTWVYSKGNVYEVHWDEIGENLYEKTALRQFPWLSGAIVVPSDQASLLAAISKLKCGN